MAWQEWPQALRSQPGLGAALPSESDTAAALRPAAVLEAAHGLPAGWPAGAGGPRSLRRLYADLSPRARLQVDTSVLHGRPARERPAGAPPPPGPLPRCSRLRPAEVAPLLVNAIKPAYL